MFFPKVIVSFPKDEQFEIYKIRYGALSAFIFIFLSIAVLQNIFTFIVEKEFENDIYPLSVFFMIFIVSTIIEIKLTKFKISKAVNSKQSSKM